MLLKPNEIDYIELEVEEELDQTEEDDELDLAGKPSFITGKTVLLGGASEPIFLDDELSFLLSQEPAILLDGEDEFIFGTQPIVIGGGYDLNEAFDDSYDSSSAIDFNENFDDDLLYDLDTDFSEGAPEADFISEEEIEESINLNSEGKNWKSSTLIGKVDNKLLNKIKEYRENVQEMSNEKLSSLSSGEEREKILMEASNLIETTKGSARDITQMIAELDRKVETLVSKYTDMQVMALDRARNSMLKEVESEVESVIIEQIEIIKNEAEEHIDETVQYYKKKLESDNHVLSTANNIIARREQILDEAYAKSLSIVEDAEVKSQEIIERSSLAHEEAQSIIQEYEQKGEVIIEEAHQESERIISDANVESARIIQAAEDQHQDILDAATQDGFSVGYQEGKEEAIKENAELLRETLNALNKLYAAFPVAAKQNQEKITRISYQIADSVLGDPATEKPDLCQRVFDKAIQIVGDLEQVRIKVNPVDLDVILPKQEYFKYVIPDVGEFIITGDRTINKGNCIITVKSEEINISINTQISILEAVFNEAMINDESFEEGYEE